MEPPPEDKLPPEGYSKWSGTYSFTMSGTIKTTTFKYTITKLDGSTYEFDTKKEEGIAAPDNQDVALGAAEAVSPLNAAMLKYCLDSYGTQVGDGQCYALGAEPLNAIGAAPPNGTEFGDEVDLESMAPGDIVQFLWCKFKGDFPDGSFYTMYAGDEASSGNHTGIVFEPDSDNQRFVCLEQNINGALVVTHRTYRLKDMYEGTIKVYRPRAA
eukprot:TRINITY_DN68784_c0_g1_i1.p1 TRINITY_DN68784_c0_g1~~TRINITY_DN68784_c0_g1_i1.p1  ORF type:complete len:213 (+),score=32.45 TRINITY_DN68784_c0_g1_i1:56-694(+)